MTDVKEQNLQRTGTPCKPGIGSGSDVGYKGVVSESSAGDVGDKFGFSSFIGSLTADVILFSGSFVDWV